MSKFNNGFKKVITLASLVTSICVSSLYLQTTNPSFASAPSTPTKWEMNWSKIKLSGSNKIIVIKISEQKASLFQKNKFGKMEFVRSFKVVTGKDKTPTPTGIFSINANRQITPGKNGVELNGSYGKAYVGVWLPFLDNQIALHNAPWRNPDEFGDVNNFRLKGSHGCVNMDRQDVEWLYNNLPNKTKVLVIK
jgi:lipoprotein-anchoring transpeptidase ErfK/SrfK